MQTVPYSPSDVKSKPSKAQELRARIDGSLATLANAVDEVRASEAFVAYLDTQAKFHRYSWHNCMLIAMQRPSATQVAGYRQWQKLGRQVRKGEKSIAIVAPCTYKREIERDDGETDTEAGVYFRAVSVFDVGQTDGPDLPTVEVPTIDGAADDLLAKLVSVASSRDIRVTFGAIPSGAFGVSKGGSIDIDDTHATGQQAKTLAHELAHEALHKSKNRPDGLTRSAAELEAEATAFIVGTHFGLDSEVRSSRYIALWDGDSKALKASLERIATTARDIIDDLEALDARKAVA